MCWSKMCVGKFPTQRHEASHLRPSAIGDEQRVGADVERRGRAEFAAPHADGAHVLEVLIQHVRDHAQHVGKLAVCDLVLEVADDDRGEVLAHDIDCLAPIRRNRPGDRRGRSCGRRTSSRSVRRAIASATFGAGKASAIAREIDLVTFDALLLPAGGLHPRASSLSRRPPRLWRSRCCPWFRVGT